MSENLNSLKESHRQVFAFCSSNEMPEWLYKKLMESLFEIEIAYRKSPLSVSCSQLYAFELTMPWGAAYRAVTTSYMKERLANCLWE